MVGKGLRPGSGRARGRETSRSRAGGDRRPRHIEMIGLVHQSSRALNRGGRGTVEAPRRGTSGEKRGEARTGAERRTRCGSTDEISTGSRQRALLTFGTIPTGGPGPEPDEFVMISRRLYALRTGP
jgi:hypothetical protein